MCSYTNGKKYSIIMIPSQLILLLLGTALGTYLLRYLPMRYYQLLNRITAGSKWHYVIVALGPAAIIALLVVSLRGLISIDEEHQWQADLIRIVIACMLMGLVRVKCKNTIAITFVGVCCYGVVLAWQVGALSL